MTQEEILEYKKMCAEFLGYTVKPKNDWYNYEQAWLPDGKTHYTIGQLKFHSDWNWIMEVVEAIEKLPVKYFVEVKGATCDIHNVLIKDPTFGVYVNKLTKKEAVVQAINQFLIWYENEKI